MMRLISRLLCISLATLFAVILSIPLPAFAAGSEGGIGLAPAHVDPNNPATRGYFIRSVAPAGTFSDQVIVANSTSDPVQLYVNAVDGLTSPNTGAVYANRQDAVRKAGVWVTPDVSMITAPAQSRILIGFTVHVPADAVPGDHLAGLAFENAKPTTTSGGGAIAVTTVLRSVIGVLVQVPGPAAFHLRIDGVSIQPSPAFATAAVVVTLADDGLLMGKPLLEIRVKGDHYDRTVSQQLDTLLPADVIALAVPWPDALAEGAYQVTVTGSGAGLSAPVTFAAGVHLGQRLKGSRPVPPASAPGLSPWWLLLAAGIALGVGLGVGLMPSLWRRRQRPAHPARIAAPLPARSKAMPTAERSATEAAVSGIMNSAPAGLSPEQEALTSIEIEITPRRFRFLLGPGQPFSFGEEEKMLGELPLTAEEERRVLDAAHSLAVSSRVWEAVGADANRAFSPEGLAQSSIHVRLAFASGARWATWHPIDSVPQNLWAFCEALHELATTTVDRQVPRFVGRG